MTTAKDIIHQLFHDVLNGGKLPLLKDLISADYVDHNPAPGQAPGAEGVIAKVEALRRGFPDLVFELEGLISEGDLAAVRYHWRGTQAGKKVRVGGMDFYRIQDGRIAEHWDVVDQLSLIKQLGIKL